MRVAAVNACNPGVMIEEPIKSWIQRGGIKNSRCAEESEVVEELRQRVGDKRGIGKGCFAERRSSAVGPC